MFRKLINQFKRKSETEAKHDESTPSAPESTFTAIVCIPGMWNSWSEFILKLIEVTNGEYIAAGNIIINAKRDKHYSVEFCEYDEKMIGSFSYAGLTTGVSEPFLADLDNHKHVIYLSGDAGTLEGAESMAYAVDAILKAGGIGVKVETTGKAFEGTRWTELLELPQARMLYEMYVIDLIVDDDGSVYSCGMQNLGYEDVMISGEDFQEAVNVIRIFNFYQMVDQPKIQSNQTFSTEANAPRFRITSLLQQPNEDHLFYNPFGMWHLKKD